MFNPAKFAMQMIQNNPQVMNNPMAKQYLEVIQNGDSAKGQEVANNILKTYGMTSKTLLFGEEGESDKTYINIHVLNSVDGLAREPKHDATYDIS